MKSLWKLCRYVTLAATMEATSPLPSSLFGQSIGTLPPKGEMKLPGEQIVVPRFTGAAAPFDVSDYATLPNGVANAAPLYLDALSEIGPELAPIYRSPSLQRVTAELSARVKELDDLATRLGHDPANVSTEELRRTSSRYSGVIEKVKTAQSCDSCMFMTGFDITTLLPHAQAARTFAELVDLEIEMSARDGRIDNAIDSLSMVLRLSNDLRPRGGAVVQLVANWIERAAARSAIRIVNAPVTTCEQIARLIRVFEEHLESRPDPTELAMKAEYLSTRCLLEKVVRDPKGLLKSLDEFGIKLSAAPVSQQLADAMVKLAEVFDRPAASNSIDGVKRDVESLRKKGGLDRAVEILNRSYEAHAKWIAKEPGEGYREQRSRMKEESRKYSVPVAGLVCGSFDVISVQRQAAIEAAIAVALIRRYRFDHDTLPPIGEGLRPFVAAMPEAPRPIDPYTGDLLKMAKHGPQLIIYSVGPDGQDDGGVELNQKADPPAGDCVFPIDPLPKS